MGDVKLHWQIGGAGCTPPTTARNFLDFMQFFLKNLQIRMGNTGSAPELGIYTKVVHNERVSTVNKLNPAHLI